MKQILLSAACLLFALQILFAQTTKDLPGNAAIVHYKLSVGYHTTTVLIFPTAIDTADRGVRDVMVQKQNGLPAILKVKARKKGFLPTNLHVFLMDGRIYAFDVYYTANPEQTTYDLSDVVIGHPMGDKGKIREWTLPTTKQQLEQNFIKIKERQPFIVVAHKSATLKIILQSIYHSGDCMYIGLQIKNYSSLPFEYADTRVYVRDGRQVKRSSIQVQEVPVIDQWQDSQNIADQPCQLIIAIKKMTLTDRRRLVIELNENDGERRPFIQIPNRLLVRARVL